MPRERNTLLSQARLQRGWSQAEVARHLDVDPAYVRRWEYGLVRPSPVYRERLCALFGMTVDQLGLLTEAEASVVQREGEAVAEQQTNILDPLLPLFGSGYPSLVGRGSLLQQLKSHLCAGSSVVLTALHGLPGVGKTTLALSLVTDVEVQANFPDGILWAGLGPAPDVVTCLARWGSLLGIRSEDLPDRSMYAWALALRAAIGQRHMLLVLDDAWRAEDVMALRVGGSHCAYVVTTRLPVLGFLTGSEPAIAVPELPEEDALVLLRRFVPELVTQEPQTALELVRLVGGLPLALTLMGGYLRMQAATGQPRRLQTALSRLRDVEQRLQVSKPLPLLQRPASLLSSSSLSLQASIAISVEYVPEPARSALSGLAVFPAKPNTFSEAAALAASLSSIETLDILTDAGLLEVSGQDRYSLHQTIADYARAQGSQQEAKRRLVEYWEAFTKAHERDYEVLERESQNLLAALEAAIERQMQEQFVRLVSTFGPSLLQRGLYRLLEGYLRQGLQAAEEQKDVSASVQLLRLLGDCTEALGDYKQAEQAYVRGLQTARALGQQEAVSALLERLGFVAQEQGAYSQAEAYLEEGLQLAKQAGETTHICGTLNRLAWVTFQHGNYTQVEAYAQESLTLAQEQQRRDLMAEPLKLLGLIAEEQGQWRQSEQYLQEGLSRAGEVGQRALMIELLNNLGYMEETRGHLEQAESYLQEALTLSRQLGHRALLSLVLENLGDVVGKKGEYQQACAYLEEAIELARAIKNKRDLTMALTDWGNVHLQFGHLEQARGAFQEVLLLNQGTEGIQKFVGEARYGLARLAAVQGNLAEAKREGEVSLAILEKVGHHMAKDVRNFLQTVELPEQHRE